MSMVIGWRYFVSIRVPIFIAGFSCALSLAGLSVRDASAQPTGAGASSPAPAQGGGAGATSPGATPSGPSQPGPSRAATSGPSTSTPPAPAATGSGVGMPLPQGLPSAPNPAEQPPPAGAMP